MKYLGDISNAPGPFKLKMRGLGEPSTTEFSGYIRAQGVAGKEVIDRSQYRRSVGDKERCQSHWDAVVAWGLLGYYRPREARPWNPLILSHPT